MYEDLWLERCERCGKLEEVGNVWCTDQNEVVCVTCEEPVMAECGA